MLLGDWGVGPSGTCRGVRVQRAEPLAFLSFPKNGGQGVERRL